MLDCWQVSGSGKFSPELNQALIVIAQQAQNHPMIAEISARYKDRQCPSVASMPCALPPSL